MKQTTAPTKGGGHQGAIPSGNASVDRMQHGKQQQFGQRNEASSQHASNQQHQHVHQQPLSPQIIKTDQANANSGTLPQTNLQTIANNSLFVHPLKLQQQTQSQQHSSMTATNVSVTGSAIKVNRKAAIGVHLTQKPATGISDQPQQQLTSQHQRGQSQQNSAAMEIVHPAQIALQLEQQQFPSVADQTAGTSQAEAQASTIQNEHLNQSNSKHPQLYHQSKFSSSSKQQIQKSMRSNSPLQSQAQQATGGSTHHNLYLNRATSSQRNQIVIQSQGTSAQVQTGAAASGASQTAANLNIKMPQLSENKWGVSSLGSVSGHGGVHASHKLRSGGNYIGGDQNAQTGVQGTAASGNSANQNDRIVNMPAAGLASNREKGQVVTGIGQGILGTAPDFLSHSQYQFMDPSAARSSGVASNQANVASGTKSNGIDWLSNEEKVQTQQSSQQNTSQPSTQQPNQLSNNSIFKQAAASKLGSNSRKIGAISGQHAPYQHRGKNAPFGQNTPLQNQGMYQHSQRRNLTTHKDPEHLPAPTSNQESNQSVSNVDNNRGGFQPAGTTMTGMGGGPQNSSEGETSSTCNTNTRAGGFKGQGHQTAISTAYNVKMNTTLNEAAAAEKSRTGSKFPKSVAFEIAKPSLIQNRGQSVGVPHVSGQQAKKSFRRSRQQPSTQSNMISCGLSLVGQPLQTESSQTGQNNNQMTPGSAKHRFNSIMNDTQKSIKMPYQKQSAPLGVLPHSLEKLQEEHMQQAQPPTLRGVGNSNQSSIGKRLMLPIKATASAGPSQQESSFNQSQLLGSLGNNNSSSADNQSQMQTSGGAASNAEYNKIQLQSIKQSDLQQEHQSIREKIKAKAKRKAQEQALQKQQQQSQKVQPLAKMSVTSLAESKPDPIQRPLMAREMPQYQEQKKKLPIHLRSIRGHAKSNSISQNPQQIIGKVGPMQSQTEGANASMLMVKQTAAGARTMVRDSKSNSSFSNGTLPNQPPVSPEEQLDRANQQNKQENVQAPHSFTIQLNATDDVSTPAKSPRHNTDFSDNKLQSPLVEPQSHESPTRKNKEHSFLHNKLRQIQRQSKQLQQFENRESSIEGTPPNETSTNQALMNAAINSQLDAKINIDAESPVNKHEHLSLKSPQKSQYLMMIEQEKTQENAHVSLFEKQELEHAHQFQPGVDNTDDDDDDDFERDPTANAYSLHDMQREQSTSQVDQETAQQDESSWPPSAEQSGLTEQRRNSKALQEPLDTVQDSHDSILNTDPSCFETNQHQNIEQAPSELNQQEDGGLVGDGLAMLHNNRYDAPDDQSSLIFEHEQNQSLEDTATLNEAHTFPMKKRKNKARTSLMQPLPLQSSEHHKQPECQQEEVQSISSNLSLPLIKENSQAPNIVSGSRGEYQKMGKATGLASQLGQAAAGGAKMAINFGSSLAGSKHPSSDSSFARTFKMILEESSQLQRKFSQILKKQLKSSDKEYDNFVESIYSRMREYKKNNFYKSMRLQRRNEDLIIKDLSYDKVVQHIECEKAKQIHSEKYRLVHSDMSGQHFTSNSIHQSHASILSPYSSGIGGGMRIGGKLYSQYPRRSKRRFQAHYNSFSMGLIAPSARVFTLPDLNHRHRNSLCNMRDVIGLSENMSQRFVVGAIVNKGISSNSNQTTPLTGGNNSNNPKTARLIAANPLGAKPIVPVQEIAQEQKADEAVGKVPMSLAQLFGTKKIIQANPNSKVETKTAADVQQTSDSQVDGQHQVSQAQLPSIIPMAIEQHKRLHEQFKQQAFVEAKKPAAAKKYQQARGKLIQWYEGELIGQGTTGVVNLALNRDTGLYFVVKKINMVHQFLGLEKTKVKAIKKEIDMYKTLKHANIVEYYGCEVIENNTMCIYLEYMPGGSIADGCKRFTNYTEKSCRQYTYQILQALHYLHQRDIVHGDLKGANVLCSKDGEKVKLCDLGNARQLESSCSSINTVINGTLAWMAPEAQYSKVGCKSDIWSLGCLLVEMLTGGNPWGTRFEDGNQVFMLQRALQDKEIPKIPTENTSEACQAFIGRCLKHSYSERPHADELLQDPWMQMLDNRLTIE